MRKKVILASHRTAEIGSDLWRPSNATFPADSRPAAADCSRLCSTDFRIYPRMDSPQLLWEMCSSA